MFTGNEDHEISLQDAADLTANYRAQFTSTGYIKGEYFGKTAIETVLAQEGCVGIRIYYGLNSENVPKLVIVGVNEYEDDMTTGTILDMGVLCPPTCGVTNDLNS